MVRHRNAIGDLFKATETPAPRSPNVKRMHVFDAGNGCDNTTQWLAFKCGRCGYEEDGYYVLTVTQAKLGLPCPKCNE